MGKTVMDNNFYSPVERKHITRIVFSFILLSLISSFFSSTLIHQLRQPVIRHPYVDLTYWLMHLLHIPEAITGNFITACVFDALLFTSCVLPLLYPGKRLFIAAFIILFFIYFITFNTYGGHHTNQKIGILLIAIPFTVANNKSFNYLWQALRYFLLFAYSCAFLWKLLRFTWLHADQGMLIMKKNLAAYLYFKPNTLLADTVRWFIQHPAWVTTLFIAGFLMEGLFIIGFFTKKFDTYLFILSILLPIGFWFMADTHFMELLILSAALINFHKVFSMSKTALSKQYASVAQK
jgi:hypothetical protein